MKKATAKHIIGLVGEPLENQEKSIRYNVDIGLLIHFAWQIKQRLKM